MNFPWSANKESMLLSKKERLTKRLRGVSSSLEEERARSGRMGVSSLKKMYAKALRSARMHYEGAATNRKRSDWTTTDNTPYGNISKDLSNLIARSRYCYDNDTMYHAAVNSIVNNVICTGMRPQAVVTKANGNKNTMINDSLMAGWDRFNDEWDRRGKMTFYEAQRLGLRTTMVSGAVIINTVPSKPGSLLPVAKQMVEPDRLDTQYDTERVTKDNNKPEIQTLHGIDLDRYGFATGYHFQGVNGTIPAGNVNHVYMQDRPEQYTGTPWGTAAIDSIWDTHQLQEDTLIKSRALADLVWWMQPNGDDFGKEGDTDDDGNAVLEALSFLRTQNEPKVIKGDDTITDSVQPLVKMIMQGAISSMGSSYMTVSRDLGDINFSASRHIVQEERRFYRAIQKWWAKSFCQREWDDFVYWMVFTGQVKGVTPEMFSRNPHKYTAVWWKPESWEWVDPLKDVSADALMQERQLASDSELLAKSGKDVDSHYALLAEEKAKREKLGIDIYRRLPETTKAGIENETGDTNNEDQKK